MNARHSTAKGPSLRNLISSLETSMTHSYSVLFVLSTRFLSRLRIKHYFLSCRIHVADLLKFLSKSRILIKVVRRRLGMRREKSRRRDRAGSTFVGSEARPGSERLIRQKWFEPEWVRATRYLISLLIKGRFVE